MPITKGPIMRTLLFSSQNYDRESFLATRVPEDVDLHFQPARLALDTVALADGFPVVCAFINDDLSAPVLEQLAQGGTRLIALRSAGFNHVDLPTAKRLGLSVVRVPAYSPHAVAEHAVALVLSLNRHLHRAYNRTRDCPDHAGQHRRLGRWLTAKSGRRMTPAPCLAATGAC
jgi:D-lactate dehydrogenase